MECAIMTRYLKSPGFVDLLIPCVFLTELGGDDATRWDILFRGWYLGWRAAVENRGKWVVAFFFYFLFTPLFPISLFLLRLLPKLISSSGFSAEHLAPRRSRGWGSVTFDEWIHLWLTPLLSDCLILTLSISSPNSGSLPFSFTLSEPPFWPLLPAQDSGCRFNWIVLNSGSLLHLLWSSRRLFDSDFLWSTAL